MDHLPYETTCRETEEIAPFLLNPNQVPFFENN